MCSGICDEEILVGTKLIRTCLVGDTDTPLAHPAIQAVVRCSSTLDSTVVLAQPKPIMRAPNANRRDCAGFDAVLIRRVLADEPGNGAKSPLDEGKSRSRFRWFIGSEAIFIDLELGFLPQRHDRLITHSHLGRAFRPDLDQIPWQHSGATFKFDCLAIADHRNITHRCNQLAFIGMRSNGKKGGQDTA